MDGWEAPPPFSFPAKILGNNKNIFLKIETENTQTLLKSFVLLRKAFSYLEIPREVVIRIR